MENESNRMEGNNANTVLANRFSHTIENCLFAKEELLKNGFSEDDFYLHDRADSDRYLNGEPMRKCKDDDCISALELYKESQRSEKDDEDFLDWHFENGLL